MEETLIKLYKLFKPQWNNLRCCESCEGLSILCDPRLGYDPIEIHIASQYLIRGSL